MWYTRNINLWNNIFIIQGCVTKDGPDPKKPCVFPFEDRGLSHNKCTKGTSGGKPWCPTEVDKLGYYMDGKWGNCPISIVCGTKGISAYRVLLQHSFQNNMVFQDWKSALFFLDT